MRIVVDVAELIGEAAPELRANPDEIIHLRRGAERTMWRESRHVAPRRRDEWGGWLFQDVLAGDDTIVEMATGPGPDAQVSPAEMTFDVGAIVDTERELRDAGSRLIRIGSWHRHPAGTDGVPDPVPSPQDIASWASGFQRLEGKIGADSPAWIGLIVTAERDNWTFPDIHGYVLRRDRASGRIVYGPARIWLGGEFQPWRID